jgi:signal transduction histidine kinase
MSSPNLDAVATALHASTIQRLFGVGLTLKGLAAEMPNTPLAETLAEVVAELDMAIVEIQDAIAAL